MSIITKNGKAFSGGNVFIAMFGTIDYEVTAISYSAKQSHTANNSLGSNKPTSYSMGKITNEANITLRLKSISMLEKAAGGDLLKIKPFTINVTFVDDENEMINDTLLVKFQDMGRSVGDDDDIKQQFNLFCLDIEFNNASV